MLLYTKDYEELVDDFSIGLSANFKSSQTKQIYEGVIDFSSIKYPAYPDGEGEFYNTVKFSLRDKLSALNILSSNTLQRGNIKNATARIPSAIGNVGYQYQWLNLQGIGNVLSISTYKVNWSNNTAIPGEQLEHPEQILKLGDVLISPDILGIDVKNDEGKIIHPSDKDKLFIVIDGGTHYLNGIKTTWVRLFPNYMNPRISWEYFIPDCKYYDRKYYNIGDICIYESDPTYGLCVKYYDALKIIQALISQLWGDVEIINLTKDLNGNPISNFRLPLNWTDRLVDEYPLGKEPLDALAYLANSMNCYMFFNQEGNFVLQNRISLDDSDPNLDKTIPVELISKMEKEEFWDKLIDVAEVTVNSWIRESEDSQEYLTGTGYAYKREGIKPRNQLSKEVFIDSDFLSRHGVTINQDGTLSDSAIADNDQSAILNHLGDLKAEDDLDFYGKRHIAYNLTLCKIIFEMTNWEMLDTFKFVKQKCFEGDKNNGRYFIQKLDFNDSENTVDIKLVSISRVTYDESSILIGNGGESTAIYSKQNYCR